MSSPFFLKLFNVVTEQSRYNKELEAAIVEFQEIGGQIMETDRSYDARVNAFHNWYILDRPLKSNTQSPLQYFIEYNRNSLPTSDLEGFIELESNIHTVFQLKKLRKDSFRIKDLITKKRYWVEGVDQVATMDPGEIFNSRIFKHGKKYHLSNYVIVHPAAVSKTIKQEARKVRKKKKDVKSFLFRLLFFQSRWEQFTQWDVRNIYRFEENTRATAAL